MLEVSDLCRHFGGLKAVDGVSFTLRPHTITGLIGPNGAGKTTLFSTLAGSYRPSSGGIRFLGKPIGGLAPDQIFHQGLSRTFQIPRPFPELTVLENLMVAAPRQPGERFWNNWFRRGAVQRADREVYEQALHWLEFLNLRHVADLPAKNLSGGQQKLVELGRVLMGKPKLILLDEPGAGVNPSLLAEIITLIRKLHADGMTFLLIEHNMDLVMNLCEPILVMANGRLLMEGTAAEVQKDPRVLDAYLGGNPL